MLLLLGKLQEVLLLYKKMDTPLIGCANASLLRASDLGAFSQVCTMYHPTFVWCKVGATIVSRLLVHHGHRLSEVFPFSWGNRALRLNLVS